MMKPLTVLVASIAFLSSPLRAEVPEGALPAADLLKACTTPDESWISFCNGYMQSVFDFAAIQGLACYQDGLTRTDLAVLFEREASVAIARQGDALANVSGFTLAAAIFSDHLACS